MTTLVRWQPYRGAMRLHRVMDRLFDESFVRPRMGWQSRKDDSVPAVDVYETPEEVVLTATVPGFDPEDLDVSVMEGTLTIKGEHEAEEAVEGATFIRRERRKGSFSRSLVLPDRVVAGEATADYSNGILTLTFPKAVELKPESIEISIG